MLQSTVSVIIPAYNPGVFLRAAVDSVTAQEPAPLEILVVDDGSTEPLDLPEHPLVRVIRQPNKGLSAARNRGVAEARGDLLAFLDADDVWYPGKLAAQLPLIRPDVGLCSCDFDLIIEGEPLQPGWGGGAADYRELLKGNAINPSGVIARRSVLLEAGGFDERLPRAEDWDAWLAIARISSLAHCPQVLVGYRRHGNNMSNDYRGMFRCAALVLWRHRRAGGLRSLPRMGEIYGTQAFDRFRLSRRPSDLVWATALCPVYVLRQARRQVRTRLRPRSTPRL